MKTTKIPNEISPAISHKERGLIHTALVALASVICMIKVAATSHTVHDICCGLPNVFPSKIFPVSVDPRSILKVPNTYRPTLGGWVRLRKGVFKGNIAVITNTSPSLLIDIKVVPQVIYDPPQKKGVSTTVTLVDLVDLEEDSRFAQNYNPKPELLKRWDADRPVQTLFNPNLAKERNSQAFQWKHQSCLSLFKGIMHDPDGYAILRALDTDWYFYEDAVSSVEEYSLFTACSSILADAQQKTVKQITSRSFHLDDAVKVIGGNSRGLFGRIFALRENEADLFLPLEGLTSTIPLTSLQKNLKIGNEVHVELGSYKGFTGWVVNSDNESVWLFNHETGTEVRYVPLNFYTTDTLSRLKFLRIA